MKSEVNTYLKEVQSRSEDATVGPWKLKQIQTEGWQSYHMVQGYQRSVKYRDFIRDFDAVFMAESRTDVPTMFAMIKDLLEYVDKMPGQTKEKERLFESLSNRIKANKQ